MDETLVITLEKWIDQLDSELPALTKFILPVCQYISRTTDTIFQSGGKSSATLHVARSVCRRAERCIVPLMEQQQVDAVVEKYINRLSDFLFVAARYVAMKEDKPEVVSLNRQH